jgi:hypothetical protein
MKLSSRFGRNSPVLRSDTPLSDDQIACVAPSIFAANAHDSRSDRYTYIPTSDVLRALRTEGFQPFMVCQTRVRDENKRDHTKHLVRLRHASQVAGKEAHEIILLNSHDGTSSYQMLAGMFRFVCMNGLVLGETTDDIRIPHKGDVKHRVVESAFEVLDGFQLITEKKECLQSTTLTQAEQKVFATAALSLRYDDPVRPAPITSDRLLTPRRFEDNRSDLWSTFNRVQENLTKGGISGRSATGRNLTTRAVTGIDADIKLNRACGCWRKD